MTKAKRSSKDHAAGAPASELDGADTEARILAAARRVFTRAGTAGARMQDIAREAGVNQALLHYYFRSKEALADRVVREAAASIFSALPRVMTAKASLEDILRALVHAYIDTVRRTPFIPPYVAAEAHQRPERVVQIIREITGADPSAATPMATPRAPVPNMPHSSHFLRVSRAMAARAMETCSTVVACAQRWCR